MAIQKPKSLGTRVEKVKHQLINTHASKRGMTVADWVNEAIDEKFERETLTPSVITEVKNDLGYNPMRINNDCAIPAFWNIQNTFAESYVHTIYQFNKIEPAFAALMKVFIK